MSWAHHAAAVDNTRKCIRRADITPLRLRVLTRPSGQEDAGGCLWYLWAKHPKIAGSNLHHVHAVSSSVTPSPWPPITPPGRAEGCCCYTFYYSPRDAKGPLPL